MCAWMGTMAERTDAAVQCSAVQCSAVSALACRRLSKSTAECSTLSWAWTRNSQRRVPPPSVVAARWRYAHRPHQRCMHEHGSALSTQRPLLGAQAVVALSAVATSVGARCRWWMARSCTPHRWRSRASYYHVRPPASPALLSAPERNRTAHVRLISWNLWVAASTKSLIIKTITTFDDLKRVSARCALLRTSALATCSACDRTGPALAPLCAAFARATSGYARRRSKRSSSSLSTRRMATGCAYSSMVLLSRHTSVIRVLRIVNRALLIEWACSSVVRMPHGR